MALSARITRYFIIVFVAGSIFAANAPSAWARHTTEDYDTKLSPVPRPAAFQVATLSLAVGADSLSPGETTPVTVTVRDHAGQPVGETPVSLFASWGILSTAHGLSNSQGQVIVIFTAGSVPGQATISAMSGYASQSVTVQIQKSNQPPIIPYTPQPIDGAANLPMTQPLTLTWQGGDPDSDPVAYRVALGETNPPPIVANSVMTPTLERKFSTAGIYYWAVTATDGQNESSGTVWSFSFAPASLPPYTPFNPTPPNGATGVSLSPILRWELDYPHDEVITYTIAFGPVSPPPIVATQTLTIYTPTDVLSDTTYHWRVTATNGLSTSVGPAWRFTTLGSSNEVAIYLPIILKSEP